MCVCVYVCMYVCVYACMCMYVSLSQVKVSLRQAKDQLKLT